MHKTFWIAPLLLAQGLASTAAPKQIIFSNLSSPHVGYYSGVFYQVSGPRSGYGEEYLAVAVTPAKDALATEIDAAVLWRTGAIGGNDVVISLQADRGGVPGAVLQTSLVTNLPQLGAAPLDYLAVDKFRRGIPVKTGRKYWVSVTLSKQLGETVDLWAQNTTDTVTALPFAYNKGAGWQPAKGGIVPAPEFAVYGR